MVFDALRARFETKMNMMRFNGAVRDMRRTLRQHNRAAAAYEKNETVENNAKATVTLQAYLAATDRVRAAAIGIGLSDEPRPQEGGRTMSSVDRVISDTINSVTRAPRK